MYIWGLSGKYPAILNISRTGRVDLAASQRRPYFASVNSHSAVGLVSRQRDAVDWACVLCDRRIHNDQASRSTSALQRACPFYSSRAGFFGKTSHHPGLSAPLEHWIGSLRLLACPKAKIAFAREEIRECDDHTVHKLSQWHLTADWLAPRESDCLRMHSKVSSDWLPSYIRATRPVLEIFKMAGYFPNSPRTSPQPWLHMRCRFAQLVKELTELYNMWCQALFLKYLQPMPPPSIIQNCALLG